MFSNKKMDKYKTTQPTDHIDDELFTFLEQIVMDTSVASTTSHHCNTTTQIKGKKQKTFDDMMERLKSIEPKQEFDILSKIKWSEPIPELSPTDVDTASGRRHRKAKKCCC